ncbi:LCP family protein [Candidatus Microgenomates bacterium]|nr:LCP family protein [Candidatus Microgenomates bacterium]
MLVARIGLVSGILLLVAALFVFLREPLGVAAARVFFLPKMATLFLFGSPSSLESQGGRTSILLLGVGGAGHEAPELTDTMIFVSLDHKGDSPVFLSLPRDIWIPSLRAKLNTAYYYGNQKREGGGVILAKASVTEIIDQPVHYGAAVDFVGFVQLVDLLGGAEIEVERTFDDFKYPIPGRETDECGEDPEFRCRYEHIHFEKGLQTMDGQTTLKFVRSRNAEGEEGTDFARSSRQQKVLVSIKQKMLSRQVLFNPRKLKQVWDTVVSSVKTDIPEDDLPILARMILRLDKEKIRSVVLDGGAVGDAQTGFLVHPPISPMYDNQWVLTPRDGTWGEVREWVKGLLR